MSVEIFARRLRPFLSARFHQLQCPRTTRFLAVPSRSSARKSEKDITHDYEKRVNQLEAYAPVSKWYPRYQQTDGSRITQKSMFEAEHGHLQTGETAEATKVVLSGMLCPLYRGKLSDGVADQVRQSQFRANSWLQASFHGCRGW